MLKNMLKNNIIKLLLILIISIINYSCNPDIADSPIAEKLKRDREIIGTLNNKMVFSIDGKEWISDNSSRAFFRDSGIEIVSSQWIQDRSVIETLKLFIYLDNQELKKINYIISKLEIIDNDNLKINFGQFRIYPYSAPIKNINYYNSQIGNIEIIDFDSTYIAGKFNLDLFEFQVDSSKNIIIKNGYFKINIIK